jgi:hypothetical protein
MDCGREWREGQQYGLWEGMERGSAIWTVGGNGERVVNWFETWCWGRMLKIKWTDGITIGDVFQRAKENRLLFKMLKNKLHLWIRAYN